jgi:hypothetical protein
MERSAWTDERLDDRFDQIDRRFDHVDRDLADLRSEMREGFASMRSEGREEFASVRSEIDALRQTMIRFGGGMLLGFISVLAAILARGA